MANDFELLGPSWAQNTIDWFFDTSIYGWAESTIQRAFDAWDAVIDLDFNRVDTVSEAEVDITFTPIDGAFGVLAQAGGSYYVQTNTYVGNSAVEFDTAEDWVLNEQTGEYHLAGASDVTLLEVALHEIGHVIGLDHTDNPDALMYFNAGGSAMGLTEHDIAGAQSIYGAETTVVEEANALPEVVIEDQTLLEYKWVRLNSVLTASDADGDEITRYEIRDDTAENSFWADGGVVDASTGYEFDAANLSGVWFQGAATPDDQTLQVRAFDGTDWGEWEDFVLTTVADTNAAPTVIANDVVITAAETALFHDFVTAEDTDVGDTIESYNLWDSDGDNSFIVNGVEVDASAGYVASAQDTIEIRAEANVGTTQLWARASDGEEWSAWQAFDLETIRGNVGNQANIAPVVTIEDQTLLEYKWVRLNSVLTANDANGDEITRYEIRDDTAENSFWADGGVVDASTGYEFDAANLSGVWFQGAATSGDQTLQVRAFDGTDWGEWEDFVLTTVADNNAAPTIIANDVVITAAETALFHDFVTAEDTDVGDTIESYHLWDSDGDNSFIVNGVEVDASTGYVASAQDTIEIRAEANVGTTQLWARASDGEEWSAWQAFDLETVPAALANTFDGFGIFEDIDDHDHHHEDEVGIL